MSTPVLCPTYRHQGRVPGVLGAGVPLPARVRMALTLTGSPQVDRCGLCAAASREFGLAVPLGEHAGLTPLDLERIGLTDLGSAGVTTAPAPASR